MFYTTADGASTPTERLRIDNSGLVGIGTASTAQVLQVHKAASSPSYIHITNNVSGSASSDGMLVGMNTTATALVWNQENTDMRFAVNNTERMRLTSNGLTFNGDTAAANALDDYEEGTFTPTINSGFTASYNSQAGRYTKVGNVVHFFISIDLSSLSGSSSDVYAEVEGLPFTATSTGNIDNAVTVAWEYALGNSVYHAYIEQGGTHIVLLGEPSGGSRTHWNPGQVWDDNDSRIALSGTYTTTA